MPSSQNTTTPRVFFWASAIILSSSSLLLLLYNLFRSYSTLIFCQNLFVKSLHHWLIDQQKKWKLLKWFYVIEFSMEILWKDFLKRKQSSDVVALKTKNVDYCMLFFAKHTLVKSRLILLFCSFHLFLANYYIIFCMLKLRSLVVRGFLFTQKWSWKMVRFCAREIPLDIESL